MTRRAGLATAETPAPAEASDRKRATLSRERRREIHDAADGKCFACGEPVHALANWKAVEGNVIDERCDKLRGNRSLRAFAGHLAEELRDAEGLLERFGRLRDKKTGRVRFAGERADATTTDAATEQVIATIAGTAG